MSVCCERGIPAPNPINAGWMAGPAEGEAGYREEERGGLWAGMLVQPTASDIAQGSTLNSSHLELLRTGSPHAVILS